MVQINKSATLSCNNDQTLFVQKENGVIGFDSYNLCLTGDVARAVAAQRSDAEHQPAVLIQKAKAFSLAEKLGNAAATLCLNDQGGAVMEVSYNKTATIRAQMGGHPPVVLMTNDESE